MDVGKWKGLFEWSMKYQDGTRPADWKPSEFTPERRQWLQEALKQYMTDLAERMREIKQVLDEKEAAASIQDKELLLEELMDIVSSIDYARDLHKIGGLPTLLDLLQCPYPSLRWRAAEVVATCVQNNPPVQQWFMEGGVMMPLLGLFEDQDVTCQTKALHALASIMRHYAPGLAAFRAAGGLQKVLAAVQRDDRRLVRKALAAMHYMLSHSTEDCRTVVELGGLPPLAAMLGGEDPEQRTAVLEVLALLVQTHSGWSAMKQVPDLTPRMQQLLAEHQHLQPEEAAAREEEAQLLRQLIAAMAQQTPPTEELREQQDHIDPQEHEAKLAPKTLDLIRQAQQQHQQHNQQAAFLQLPAGQTEATQAPLLLMPPLDPDPR